MSFGKVHLSKFGIFFEITSLFELAKILQKKFGNNFLFLGQKVQKSSETGISKHSKIKEISEIVLFQTFRTLRKNDFKFELRIVTISTDEII
jgi:hypothetical protein